ncbi:hypothetical protein [Pedobacter heparinus]|uniref:Uncharacterized protein n=1 Tax=Pedobacter heparinus (strain ATCC 13125 / DSM 2366 / CIP 104194 / JCM 7457 / NBRC 12017 / NCIMB 9290 / NRRL B-14731 / HIM 762-3) TaxID=485917 RepID=C6XV75_PEDHD|nr:hypothetical protein [Pedobacter heparinus]ACU03941.1 hypothetical protein Phep_1730 [Pedobacter heparinus DSM 2366]
MMKREKITFKGIWKVVKETFTGFSEHKVTFKVLPGSEILPSHYAVTTKEIEVETSHKSVQQNAS